MNRYDLDFRVHFAFPDSARLNPEESWPSTDWSGTWPMMSPVTLMVALVLSLVKESSVDGKK